MPQPLNRPAQRAVDDDPVAIASALLAATRAMERPDDPEVLEHAAQLGALRPEHFERDDPTRTAFWVNVYNALMGHAVVAFGLEEGARVPLGVFSRATYLIGGQAFSLHVIEHGLLRCNRPAPYTLWRPLRARDPRLAAAPSRFDPRIHFALNCAARSCPPIRSYAAASLDAQLDLATRAYVSQETRVDDRTGRLWLPYLCALYDRDFGDARAALRWVTPFLDEDLRAWVSAHPDASIGYGRYRWEISRSQR